MGGTGDRRLERQGSIMDRVNEQLPVSFEDFNERTTDAEADEVAHEVAAQQGEAPQVCMSCGPFWSCAEACVLQRACDKWQHGDCTRTTSMTFSLQ